MATRAPSQRERHRRDGAEEHHARLTRGDQRRGEEPPAPSLLPRSPRRPRRGSSVARPSPTVPGRLRLHDYQRVPVRRHRSGDVLPHKFAEVAP